MAVQRFSFTLTPLPNSSVLAVGGDALDRRAELYDPASRTFAPTGSTAVAHVWHTATLLPGGSVVIAGGQDSAFTATAIAELYDPSSGSFSPTGSMTTPRSNHTATLLPNGKVLVAGGHLFNAPNSALASAELYDPATGTFAATGSMLTPRQDHTATLLANGKVLLAGGFNAAQLGLTSAELYDPATETFSPTGSLAEGRGEQTATILQNGNVLVAGGFNAFPGPGLLSAELYDPNTASFSSAGTMTTARGAQTATLLPDGSVLIAGGFTDFPFTGATLASAELYHPAATTFTSTGGMADARGRHAAAALGNGDVLVAGGLGQCCSALTSAELFSAPADTTPPTITCSATPSILWPPNHKLRAIDVDVSANDDSGSVTVTLVSVTSSQPNNGLDPEDVPNDIQGWNTGADDRSGLLRAERFGQLRAYTLSYQAEDQAGNTATCETVVTVPKSLGGHPRPASRGHLKTGQ